MDKILINSRLTRVFHWSFALCVLLLITSGMYIHYPVDLGGFYNMGINTKIQTVTGIVASGIFFYWIYYIIVTQGYKELRFRLKDIADFKGLLKYYFFIEKKAPAHGKYNAGQRLIYSSWFFVFLFMIITGVLLQLVNLGNIIPFPVMLQKLRLYHFLGGLWFLGTVPLHIYLVLTEDPAKLQAMFTGWVKK